MQAICKGKGLEYNANKINLNNIIKSWFEGEKIEFGDWLFYKQGVTDPDYCVLKFTAQEAEYYCDFNIETFIF